MYKVILVEDEEIIRNGLKYTYEWERSECTIIGEASNGVEGKSKIAELEPDIVILDVNMPILNGIELLAECSEKYIFSSIILSGYDEFKYAQSAIKYGVTDYLLKPIDYEELYQALEKAKTSIKVKKNYQYIESNLLTPENIGVLDFNVLQSTFCTSKHVLAMIEYIEKNYKNKISITDLVDKIDMSVTYLNQKFKEETGYTFNDFLNRYRIKKAIEKLMDGKEKITNIAIEVGFGNYRYFSQVFKKYTNSLPSDYLNYFRGKIKE